MFLPFAYICVVNGLIYILAIFGLAFIVQNTAIILHKAMTKKQKIKNPYIQMHQVKETNDANYDEYLEYLDKKGGDLPIPKITTPEEKAFNKKVNQL